MKKGFTLVELAIVLVIISLMVAGVLAGRELIEQAQIRSQLSQLRSIATAAGTFQSKYGKLPGDFHRAVEFFPSVTGLNGDGNDVVRYTAEGLNEMNMFFREMVAAQLLADAQDSLSVAYKGKYNQAYLQVQENPYGSKPQDIFIRLGNYQNTSVTVESTTSVVGGSFVPAFSGTTAMQIDKKVDDGWPITGLVTAAHGYSDPVRFIPDYSCSRNAGVVVTDIEGYVPDDEALEEEVVVDEDGGGGGEDLDEDTSGYGYQMVVGGAPACVIYYKLM